MILETRSQDAPMFKRIELIATVVASLCFLMSSALMAQSEERGMGRAFQYAGAKSVLMSLWSVSEVASTKLVESFFRNLKEGKSKSESLASARAELRKGI